MERGLIFLGTCFEELSLGYFESSFCWCQPAARTHHRGAARPLNPKAVLCVKWLQKWSFCQQGWRSVWACSLYLWSSSSAQVLREQYVSSCKLAKDSSPCLSREVFERDQTLLLINLVFNPETWAPASPCSIFSIKHLTVHTDRKRQSLQKSQFVADSKLVAPRRKNPDTLLESGSISQNGTCMYISYSEFT